MNEEEVFFREQLRWLRSLANRVGVLYQEEQSIFNRWPETQALAITEGHGYGVAATLVVHEAIACGQLNLEVFKYPPFTGFPATREEIIDALYQLQKRRLKEEFNPLEVWSQVAMPTVKSALEKTERIMVERGFRISKWDKPKWLREMEGKPN